MSLSQIGLLYNPQLQNAEIIEKLFVVRQKQFEFLLNKILQEKEDSIPQHYLIIGQRGMGKTTLLKRVEVELHKEQYRQQFIPLLYREEQYNVKDLAEFWLNTLDALADSLQSEKFSAEILDNIDKTIRNLSKKTPKIISEEAYKFLMKICHDLSRRPVLLIDNINLVFSRLDNNGKNKQEQWALRKLLSENGAPIVVSAGVTVTNEIAEYGMPFYDFFQIQYLKKLNYEEFISLLKNLATIASSDKDVFISIQENNSRQRALLELTGGSPRLTVMLFEQIGRGLSSNINDDLEILADAITPLYKAKFEELPPQQQIILDAIALNWDAISLRKLSSATRMKNNQLSPQLKRLVDEGWIETTPAYKAKGNAYFISERFFNIYYLIRNSSRRHKDKIYCLSKFLECFYGKEELEKISDDLLKQDICSKEQMQLHMAFWDIKTLGKHKRQQGIEKIYKAFLRKDNEELRKEFDFPEEAFLFAEGNKLFEEEKYDEAIKYFKEILRANPKHELAKGRIGEIFHILEKYEEAISSFDEILRTNPQNDSAWTKEGEIFSNFGRHDDAIKCFDKALEINPENTMALGQKGEIFEELEQYENAIICFDKILEINLKNDSAWLKKGQILSRLEKYNDAIDCADKAIKLKPKNEFAWMRKGEILFNSKNYDDAIKCFDKVLKINPDFEPAWFFKALALKELKHYQESITCFNKCIEFKQKNEVFWFEKGEISGVLQYYEDAIVCFDEVLKINPNFESAWFSKGEALKKLKRYQEAISCFDKSIEFKPKDDYLLFLKSTCLFSLECYDESIDCLNKAIKLNSENEYYWFLKGMALDLLQKFAESADCYDHAIKINPKNDSFWENKAQALSCIECYDEADLCYKEAINLNSENERTWLGHGICLYIMKQYNNAIDSLNKSIKLNSKNEYTWQFKGDCLQEIQCYKDAIVCYDKAIELNPNISVFWNEKGYTLIDLKQYNEAVNCFDKAIELDSNNYVALGNKGYVLIELQKYNEAVTVLEQAISINTKNIFPKFHLLFLYRDLLGKMDNAVDLFNSINEQEINQNEDIKQIFRYYLHKTLFELYKRNEGLAKDYLLMAFEILGKENEVSTIANEYWWIKFGSVIVKLNYGSWFLVILEEKKYDIELSPYYTAIQALDIEKQDDKNGKTEAEIYLKNRAVEISEPARLIVEKMRKYLN